MKSLKIICPNGHLGFAPIRIPSFNLGVAAVRLGLSRHALRHQMMKLGLRSDE